MLENWFSFLSADKKKKRQERYFKKVYPFGLEQKEWESRYLKEKFPDSKDIKFYIYHLIILKEKLANTLLDEDEDDYDNSNIEDIINKWKKDKLVKQLGDFAIDILKNIALAQLSSKNLEEFKSKL